jgi:site-specific DNA-adenine methylase
MFSYYGSKSKLAQYYPYPKYNAIIEPFAGSARYSLFGENWKKQVILIDKYKIIADLWRYLIEEATPERILNLPDVAAGQCVDDLPVSNIEKQLIGFCVNRGCTSPCHYPGQWNIWASDKKRIATELHKIKHWKIIEGTYLDAPDLEATWFIDPPYQKVKRDYVVGKKNLSFDALSQFCKSRKGQVIVCENLGADWLPFKRLINFEGQLHTKTETVWFNNNSGTLLDFVSTDGADKSEI